MRNAGLPIEALIEYMTLFKAERFRDLFHVEGDGCEEKIFEFNYVTNTAAAGGTHLLLLFP